MTMYHYVESGLDNIWLRNGYVEEDTAYGPTVAFKDILGLHESISLAIVEQAGKLSGAEIRFLRRQMEMSQVSLAELIGVTSQSLALWEKAKAPITPPSDKLLRLIIKGHYSGQVTVRRAIDALNHRDQEGHAARLVFQEADKKWKSVS
jgi:DNA-binding transcriptional regulator YiaG